MQELDDNLLLREYVDNASEEAFATIVSRHVNKVYSVALRHTRNPHHAEEISHAVFVILAKKSRHLGKNVVLSGWLYQTARLTAQTFIRSEIRRARREEEAYMQNLSNETEPDIWTQVAPLLDAGMGDLNATDRHAIVLRFFDGKSMREVGAALGANEVAAKKRVNRAVEKLRSFFTKRGVVLSGAVLTTAISANSVQAAPIALAASISAVSTGATVGGSTLALVKGTLKLIAWAKAKTAAAAGAAILLTTGTTVVVVKELAPKNDLSAAKTSVPAKPLSPFDAFFADGDFNKGIDKAPQALMVRITHFPEKVGQAMGRVGVNTVQAVGRNARVDWMLGAAYGFVTYQMVFPKDLPNVNFDYLATLPDCPRKAFQAEIEKETGFVAHPELRETEVLVLKVKTTNAPGLRPGTINGRSFSFHNPRYSSTNQSIAEFASHLEGSHLQKTVVDETGLTNKYDLSLEWESGDTDALKQALLDRLGLELVPAVRRIEMLVVERSTNFDKSALYKEVSPSSVDESRWIKPKMETLPPVLILRPTRFEEGSIAADSDDLGRWRMLLKNSSLEYVLAAAADFKVTGNYCTWPSRIIVPPNLPQERVDLMLTVPNARERLQEEIRKKFGLAVHREIREVDALVIKDSEAVAPKVSQEKRTGTTFPGMETMDNLPLWIIAQNLEAYLKKPVLVRTGVTNHFTLSVRTIVKDKYLTFDDTELKQAFLRQLGLELVSSKEPVEMLIVERAKK